MKLFRLFILLLSALLLSACIDEDLSNCPEPEENNLRLDFRYTDEGGADIFADNIHSVDLFVYDTNGFFVTQHHVDRGDLYLHAGTELNLSPGSYRIVCWGNVATNTSLYNPTEGSPFSDAFLDFAIGQTRAAAMVGGDPLYYAPYVEDTSSPQIFRVTVPEKGVEKAEIDFRIAHSIIELYVKGYGDKNKEGQLLLPQIELTGIPAGYDFNLETFGPPVTYSGIATSETIDEQQMAVINFITPLFDRDTPMEVNIKKQSDGDTLTTVNLDDFIRDNNIVIGETTKLVIPILVEYKEVSVEINLPPWKVVPVEPDID